MFKRDVGSKSGLNMMDCFESFMAKYDQGNIPGAFQQVLISPQVAYDQLPSPAPFLHYVANYVDACVFRSLQEAFHASLCLTSLLERDPPFLNSYPHVIPRLKAEQELLNFVLNPEKRADSLLSKEIKQLLRMLQGEIPYDPSAAEKYLQNVPDYFRCCLEVQLQMMDGWTAFHTHKALLNNHYRQMRPTFTRPWYAFRYPMTFPHIETLPASDIPVLFLEPCEGDYGPLLQQLHERAALFVFTTRASQLQMLQFPDVVKSLNLPHHLLYILSGHPSEQIHLQERNHLLGATLRVLLIPDRPRLHNTLPAFLEALDKTIKQTDSLASQDLYSIAKKITFTLDQERLGLSRIAALTERISIEAWFDTHKTQVNVGSGSESPDYLALKLQQVAQKKLTRTHRKRIVHIVPQVVDGGHAPSLLLENLLLNHDLKCFEPFLICTERLQFRPFEYPHTLSFSASSQDRGRERLAKFHQRGISIRILDTALTLERSADDVASLLSQWRADVAIFHGPDVINTMCAQMTDAPLKILYEHGTPPRYPGYDVVIASAPAAAEVYKELFAELKLKVHVLPFAIDVRSTWEPQPFAPEQCGLPSGTKILTTISNHLENRLSEEMCLAIAEILQRNPDACYAPIGRMSDEGKFRRFFRQHKVEDRILFLGGMSNPSQYARSMHIYLNEFPFGSCLGMLDAMAAGCPVVSMYDTKGPPQARYGGDYFGMDRVVVSGKREEYVNLASRLLQDDDLYREWSEHAKKQFENHSNVPKYVKAFESILMESCRHDF